MFKRFIRWLEVKLGLRKEIRVDITREEIQKAFESSNNFDTFMDEVYERASNKIRDLEYK